MTEHNVGQDSPSPQPQLQAAQPPVQPEAGESQGGAQVPVPAAHRWSAIPVDLRERPQWCLADPEKSPRTISGLRASPTDPDTWTDFQTAIEAAGRMGFEIGFVLSPHDEFACIDLDVKHDTPQDHIDRCHRIAEAAESYAERSLSGRGLHVWVRAALDGPGCHRDGVEVYDRDRFMICTGDVVIERPIEDGQPLIDVLVEQMRPRRAHNQPLSDEPETEPDAVIIDRARGAANGTRFVAHYEGNFASIGHDDHSRADMALMQMLAFYTPNNDQLKRVFLSSALGQRDKAAKRIDYVDRTIRAVRVSQADGPSVAHGKEMALALLGSVVTKLLAPSALIPKATPDTGVGLLQRLSVDWSRAGDAEVPDVIDGLVADEDVTLLGGHGGVGKSFLALQMACATALGERILARDTRKCRVLYYSAEDGRKRLTRRLRSVAESFDYDLPALLRNLKVLDASELEPLYGESVEQGEGRRPAFTKMLGARVDFTNLQMMVEAFDPQLVIIDGASDTFDGNEIARREVRAFIKLLRRVHPHRKIAVLLMVHIDRSSARGHTSNDDGYAGSGQWHNSCRRRMFLQHQIKKERDDDGGESIVSEAFMLRVMKNQDGPADPDMELTRGPHGLWQMGVHIDQTTLLEGRPDHGTVLARLIADHYGRGAYMSTSLAPQATTGVFATLKGDPQFPRGLSRKRTADILRDLERDGVLTREPHQRANRGWAERWAIGRDPSRPFEQAAQSAQGCTV